MRFRAFYVEEFEAENLNEAIAIGRGKRILGQLDGLKFHDVEEAEEYEEEQERVEEWLT